RPARQVPPAPRHPDHDRGHELRCALRRGQGGTGPRGPLAGWGGAGGGLARPPPPAPPPPPRPITVSAVGELDAASLAFSSLSGWRERGLRERFLDLTDAVWRVRGYGDFFSYCLLAEGAVDIATEPEVSLWDLAALDILVREAGGRFTALSGQPGPHGGDAVATNGLLHEAVLTRLSRD
ncbi:inositol monophosphatase family protein, partial [Nocardia farcinica]|uniref:inositol monophosphatase family protein n=1 Tax=Nocardia farcinica TaxID=37329 RepID=UPI0024568C8C